MLIYNLMNKNHWDGLLAHSDSHFSLKMDIANMQSWKWGMWSRKWNLKCVYSKANAIYLILFIIVISLNKCCVWERLKNEKTSFKLVLLLLLLHFGKLEDIHHVKPWNTLDFGHFTVTGLALVKLISKFCFQLSPTSMTRVRLNSSKKRIFHKFR